MRWFNSPAQLPRVDSKTLIYADTEGTGVNKLNDRPTILTLDIHNVAYALDPANKHVINWMNNNMPKAGGTVWHNAKHDIHQLMNVGLLESKVRESEIICTQIMETLINEHYHKYGLDACCERRGIPQKKSAELLEWLQQMYPGEKEPMKFIAQAPLSLSVPYALNDATILRQLYQDQFREIQRQELGKVWELERSVTKALVFIERRGVPVDTEALPKAAAAIEERRIKLERTIEKLAGFNLNVNSNPQMCRAFKSLGINYVENKKTGNGIFNKDALGLIGHPLAKMVLELRSVRVMGSTFLEAFTRFLHTDGRIHCDYNQTKTDDYGTRTGRLSASDPNLQQVPKRNEDLARFIRALFIAVTGKRWGRADWSQFEFRMFTHYTRSERLIQTFIDDRKADYHKAVSALTGLQRDPYAKQLNLGLIFGMGEGLMAQKCGLPFRTKTVKRAGGREKEWLEAGPEARKIFATYHKSIPEVKPMLQKAERLAKRRGHLKTIMGRRLRFPKGRGAYKGAGLVFQGSSADMMKKKLVELDNYSYTERDTGFELDLTVHDEFDYQYPEHDDRFSNDVKEILEDTPEIRLPVYADIGSGENWWEASKE